MIGSSKALDKPACSNCGVQQCNCHRALTDELVASGYGLGEDFEYNTPFRRSGKFNPPLKIDAQRVVSRRMKANVLPSVIRPTHDQKAKIRAIVRDRPERSGFPRALDPLMWPIEPEWLKGIQSAFNRLAGINLPITGLMSLRHRVELRRFQSAIGLPADGFFNPATVRYLEVHDGSDVEYVISSRRVGREPRNDREPEGNNLDVGENGQESEVDRNLAQSNVREETDILAFRARVVQIALQEWNAWRQGQLKEDDEEGRRLRLKYWRVFDKGDRYAFGAVSNEAPWSAAFVSWVVRTAGGGGVQINPRHTIFAKDAYRARMQGEVHKFYAYGVNEIQIQLGDILVKLRGSCGPVTLGGLVPGAPGHSDVVVDVSPRKLTVVGGNLGGNGEGSVKKTVLSLDESGRLLQKTDCPYFAVVRPVDAKSLAHLAVAKDGRGLRQERNFVMLFQLVINQRYAESLAVDGVWGPMTNEAFERFKLAEWPGKVISDDVLKIGVFQRALEFYFGQSLFGAIGVLDQFTIEKLLQARRELNLDPSVSLDAVFALRLVQDLSEAKSIVSPGLTTTRRERQFYSADDGVVQFIGWQDPADYKAGYGFNMKIRQIGTQMYFIYAHIDPNSIKVKKGDKVVRGQLLGQYASPSNGSATGPHLHLGWCASARDCQDPSKYRPVVMPKGKVSSEYGYRKDPKGSGRKFHRGLDII